MTPSEADGPDVCPICGSILTPRGPALYCASCDLLYEGDDGDDGDGGDSGQAEPRDP